jgi:hypothetical protein
MDWGSFIRPAVVAAAVSGIVSVVGLVVSTRTARAIHTEKLAFDRDQAAQKLAFDERLAERKFEFDKELAERRFTYDRALHDHKRRTELAEDVLSGFYQMRDVIGAIRSPAAGGDEGKDRQKAAEDENEADALRRARDIFYVPISRYNERQKIIADLMAKRYRMKAAFGVDAIKPFDMLHEIFAKIIRSARRLITTAGSPAAQNQKETWEAAIWWMGEEDAIDKEVALAIEAIEKICRPVLEASK